MLFVIGFMLVAMPASWLAANAESLPSAQSDNGSSALSPNDSSDNSMTNGQTKNSASEKNGRDAKAQSAQASAKTSTGQAANGSPAASNAAAAANGGSQSKAAAGASNLPVAVPPAAAAQAVPAAPATGLHQGIITTIFWAGETADASNAYITNTMSAWDEKWQEHFGGVDDPDNRNGFAPAAFTPLENPFYFALPYNDYDSNGRKASAHLCSAVSGVRSPNTSWCKNAWIKIIKGNKTAYAQWQDVGPLGEDDVDYVFGTAKPKNTWGAKAGLDVSPAVRDYLGLSGIDTTSWSFVSAGAVPAGPWKDRVTTSGTYWE